MRPFIKKVIKTLEGVATLECGHTTPVKPGTTPKTKLCPTCRQEHIEQLRAQLVLFPPTF